MYTATRQYCPMNGRIQTNLPRPSASASADVPRAVATLLATTQQLQEMLRLWSLQRLTEQDVSDVYVRLGTEFNATVAAFQQYGIDLSDLYSTPQDLRAVLEACLSEDASPQALAMYLPRVRQIIFNLLQGLKNKQPAYWRAVGGNTILVP
ncbi:hypothetical protein BV25DRAFT_1837160 [Artomyces pyxidatus]|uniref:Uncharacterized protein n=1 Tax=Artomyces pyxidatus TaxID=48021 RepID=A0ACB8T606_9AGAM|nr:hypothetical protein BV25DRAFT_1837160 [Artomyces pyxidatus]